MIPIDNYSTNESEMGKWIDGKSIYQKTFVNPSLPLDVSNLSIKILVHVEATISSSSEQHAVPGSPKKLFYLRPNGRLEASGAGTITSLTIQYTKTTD